MGDEPYRVVALVQAVRSHGRVEIFDEVVLSKPNDPMQVVKAAIAYERYLDRPADELVQLADLLAERLGDAGELLTTTTAQTTELNDAIDEALAKYRAWKSQQAEPF